MGGIRAFGSSPKLGQFRTRQRARRRAKVPYGPAWPPRGVGHGEVASKEHLAFFKGYLTDLIATVKKAAADGGTLAEMQKTIPDQLAARYEQGMSKYPLGRYRDRIGVNIEAVYKKVVQKG